MPKTKTRAPSVSLEDFASVYAEVQRAGGNISDLMEKAKIENMQTANQKLSKLRESYLEIFGRNLPSLARRPRTTKTSDTAAVRAAKLLSQAFGVGNTRKSK